MINGDSIHFFGVSDGEITPDGNVIVALGRRQNTLLVVDGGAQVVQVLGGTGDGPQEFRSTPQVSRLGERVLALDPARRRYIEVVASALGEAVSYERGPNERELGVFADGAIFTTQVRFPPTRNVYTQ
jgi:hypothetical protein